MAVVQAGVSTVGVRVGYAVVSKGQARPTEAGSWKWLERANNIGGISLDPDLIDASAMEDGITRYIKGRLDHGGSFSVTWNITDEVEKLLDDMIDEYEAMDEAGGDEMYLQIWSPYRKNAYYIVVQPPQELAMSERGQNSLDTVEVQFAITRFVGRATGVMPA